MDLFALFKKRKPATADELQPFFDDFAKAETQARDDLAALETRRDAGILELPEAEIGKLDGLIDAAERRLRDLGTARAQIAQRLAAAAEQKAVDDMRKIVGAGQAAIERQIEIFAAAAPLYDKLAALANEWSEKEYARQTAYDQLDRAGYEDLRNEVAPVLSRIPASTDGGISLRPDHPFSGLRLPGVYPHDIYRGPFTFADINRALRV